MNLNDLRPRPGAKHRVKRVGRGYGSGHGGHESGRGTKGQGARAGVRMRPGYEGGQTPLWMRFPKRGFRNPLAKEYAIVDIGVLEKHFSPGEEVTLEKLMAKGIVKDPKGGLKVLGEGELTKPLIVKAQKFSRRAREKIEAAGGRAEEG
ncbi:MAG: 50S ribosomal protein L15 [Candidatus Bipolaricaulota bacterium]|nr:50S ribosomal protein L15 [Candidatus Bipolaricaulota bacterium]MDW8126292.1 50S ribosomal protein L15 [Candidatus Bipolaricaulota bacterium]